MNWWKISDRDIDWAKKRLELRPYLFDDGWIDEDKYDKRECLALVYVLKIQRDEAVEKFEWEKETW